MPHAGQGISNMRRTLQGGKPSCWWVPMPVALGVNPNARIHITPNVPAMQAQSPRMNQPSRVALRTVEDWGTAFKSDFSEVECFNPRSGKSRGIERKGGLRCSGGLAAIGRLIGRREAMLSLGQFQETLFESRGAFRAGICEFGQHPQTPMKR